MKCEEVRKIYSDRFVKMQVLEGRIENDIIVFHTSNEKLEIPIKKIFGFRGVS